MRTLYFLEFLLILRRIVRRQGVAWIVFTVLCAGINYIGVVATRSTANRHWVWLVSCVGWALMQVWLLWKHGALALALGQFVYSISGACPWPLDMSRWYAWRQWFVIALVVGLAVWGFKNVLGKQSAFPAGALDGCSLSPLRALPRPRGPSIARRPAC